MKPLLITLAIGQVAGILYAMSYWPPSKLRKVLFPIAIILGTTLLVLVSLI